MPRPKVLVPDAALDRPKGVVTALVAIVPFALGLLLVQASLSSGGSEAQMTADSERGQTELAVELEAEAEPEAEAEAEAVAESEAVAEAESEAESEAVAEAETVVAAVAAIPRRVGLGRVAYLTCDGAPAQSGPFPCPRDRDLEAQVWAALEGLPECPDLPTEIGPGDLRLTFRPGAPVEIGTRSRGPEGLADEPLLTCLSGALSEITTTIRADDLLVSFHFALLAR